MYNGTKQKRDIKTLVDVAGALLANEVFIFSSEHGKKGVTDSNIIRLKSNRT